MSSRSSSEARNLSSFSFFSCSIFMVAVNLLPLREKCKSILKYFSALISV
jgi:hypothetical protein